MRNGTLTITFDEKDTNTELDDKLRKIHQFYNDKRRLNLAIARTNPGSGGDLITAHILSHTPYDTEVEMLNDLVSLCRPVAIFGARTMGVEGFLSALRIVLHRDGPYPQPTEGKMPNG